MVNYEQEYTARKEMLKKSASVLLFLCPLINLCVSVFEENRLFLDQSGEGRSKGRASGCKISCALNDKLMGHTRRGGHYYLWREIRIIRLDRRES